MHVIGTDGNPTILDIGITHPLIDTNLNNKSTTERAFAANKYGDLKESGYMYNKLLVTM